MKKSGAEMEFPVVQRLFKAGTQPRLFSGWRLGLLGDRDEVPQLPLAEH